MTTSTPTVSDIFADANALHYRALELLEAGDVRDAAEKAWCATRRATDALLLARTGEMPPTTTMSRRSLDALAREDERAKSLVARFCTRMTDLHAECFYLGATPTPDSLRRIRETGQFVVDAERLAQG